MAETFDPDKAPHCECGSTTIFRTRVCDEKEYVILDEAGYIEVDDSDLHIVGDWRYECADCGRNSTEVEDILADRYGTCPVCDEAEVDLTEKGADGQSICDECREAMPAPW